MDGQPRILTGTWSQNCIKPCFLSGRIRVLMGALSQIILISTQQKIATRKMDIVGYRWHEYDGGIF